MRIEISLDTGDATDLAALTALVMALRGDTPADFGSPIPTVAAPPPPPASESLIEAEATRVTTAPPPPPADGPAETDKSGLPYDARIHSSTKAVNQDGTWRNKRGVDPALLASVTAELRAAGAAPPPPDAQTPEAAFAPPPPSDVPPPPAAAVPPPPPAPADGPTYPTIIKAASDKGLTYDQLNALAVTLGLAAFKDLVKRPDLFESFMAALG